ncbi:MAG: non-homologous end-joining DNA ligase, partial [Acidimicrobiia bacterium]
MPSSSDRLAEYRSKRAADKTPEPFDEAGVAGAGIFVVQKHAATRLHYDLRLEYDGVLLSWAVPAGISFDPAVKRFAAHTEDHPIEYADFEGVIPAGEYGGGEMVVWDRGALSWDEDPAEGLAKGKLLFSLHGYKLVGQWTLVQMKKNPKEWLLIKHTDAWSRQDEDRGISEVSVLTGRTVEDLRAGTDPEPGLLAWAEEQGAEAGEVDGAGLDLMLAKVADAPFTNEDWLFEVKYDGYRLVASKDGRSVHLRYRSGLDATSLFPDLTSALRRLPFDRFVIDGEVVVLDAEGRPSFVALQRRGKLSSNHEIAAAAVHSPATLFGFDLVSLGELDLRTLPLSDRKSALAQVLPTRGPLRYTDHFIGIGEALLDQAVARGWEGVMAKRSDSRYSAGRTDSWLKVKSEQTGTFAIVGFTAPKGTRASIGALHIAATADGELIYAGRVGSGFTDAQLTSMHAELTAVATPEPQAADTPPTTDADTWVEPSLACTIRFKEVTESGSLRHPVFIDVAPYDAEHLFAVESALRSEPPPPAVIDTRTTEPTNPDKVFWPDDGYTKGDLINYYTAVADHVVPYLVDRPLVLDRYPDGIDGKSFFQKNAPEYVPDWIRTEWVGNEAGKGNTYFIVDDADALR